MATDGTFETSDGVRIAYRLLPGPAAAPPLVMIQGLSGVKEGWRELSASLAAHRTVAVFDNRGVGGSATPPGPYPLDRMAQDVVELAEHLGWPRYHVMGISMGGMIAQHVALLAPQRVAGLVLGCTAPKAPPINPEHMAAWAQQPGETVRDLGARLLGLNYPADWIEANRAKFDRILDDGMGFNRPPEGIGAQMAGVMQFDNTEGLGRIAAPTLVVHGTLDQLLPYAGGEVLHQGIPNSRLCTLEGCGHMFWDMDEGRSATAVAQFLAEHDA